MIEDFTNYTSANNFINENAKVNTEFDYNSFYRAYVVSTEDPEHLGRVKIRIPTLHSSNSSCPWAYPACFTGMGFQTGMFILPPVGSIVFVAFEYSDEHRPIYFGGVPTMYAEGKSQSYGPFINGGNERIVNDDDLPLEYTGTQQIIYKSPAGSIIYFDSNDLNNLVVLRNIYGQQFKLAAEYDEDLDKLVRYSEIGFDDLNYFRISDNEYHLVIGGKDVSLGGEGGTSNYAELLNKPSINGVELNGNMSLKDIGVYNAQLKFKYGATDLGSFSANSNTETVITIPEAAVTYYTKDEITALYESM